MNHTADTSNTYYYEIDAYVDGSSRPNPGPSGIAVRLVDTRTGDILSECSGFIGKRTIHEAEYMAINYALDLSRKSTCRKVNIYSDSQLAVNQLNRIFRVFSRILEPHFLYGRKLIDTYFKEGVEILHINEAERKATFNLSHHEWCDMAAKKVTKDRRPILDFNL